VSEVKLFDPFPRKVGTSLAEFSHYWITHHGELAKEFRRITRYVQSVRLEHKPAALGSPLADTWCDGCAETWHPDTASVRAMPEEDRFPDLMADEANFVDLSHARSLVVTRERLLDEQRFDPRLRGVKVLLFARRSRDSTRADFTAAWADDAGVDLGRRLGATRHVVCDAIDHIERPPIAASDHPGATIGTILDDGYDGVRELWWPNMAALETALTRQPEAAASLFSPDSIDPAGSFALVAHERLLVA
jgi:hypothetical protein